MPFDVLSQNASRDHAPTISAATRSARNEEIIRRRAAGEGPRQIAREMGLSPNIVAGLLHREGLTDPASSKAHSVARVGSGGGRVLTDAQVVEVRARRAEGEGIFPLAAEYGVHFSTIYKIGVGERRKYAA